MNFPKLEKSWNKNLAAEFKKDYIQDLKEFLASEENSGKKIFPPQKDIFNALNSTPLNKVKAIIIGQDPYHGEGQAHGLCFSVRPGVKPPPSLKNLYKEMKADLGFEAPNHGHLQAWADSGVLMLNNVLTVQESMAGSHRKKGWENFTDAIINILNTKRENLVFILWGNDAKKKAQIVDRERHFVLESAHPSPFSVTKFYGCKHFSKTNELLKSVGIDPINWEIK